MYINNIYLHTFESNKINKNTENKKKGYRTKTKLRNSEVVLDTPFEESKKRGSLNRFRERILVFTW